MQRVRHAISFPAATWFVECRGGHAIIIGFLGIGSRVDERSSDPPHAPIQRPLQDFDGDRVVDHHLRWQGHELAWWSARASCWAGWNRYRPLLSNQTLPADGWFRGHALHHR